MRQIFNALDTTPHPSCTAKLAAKAKLCTQLDIMQRNTAVREAAVKTAMARFDEAITERDAAIAENNTAKTFALEQGNLSIVPVSKTVNKLKFIQDMPMEYQAEKQTHKKALDTFKESFKPALTQDVLNALHLAVITMKELDIRKSAVRNTRITLEEAQASLAKNLNNIQVKTAAIAAANTGMAGLNCGNNPSGC